MARFTVPCLLAVLVLAGCAATDRLRIENAHDAKTPHVGPGNPVTNLGGR